MELEAEPLHAQGNVSQPNYRERVLDLVHFAVRYVHISFLEGRHCVLVHIAAISVDSKPAKACRR